MTELRVPTPDGLTLYGRSRPVGEAMNRVLVVDDLRAGFATRAPPGAREFTRGWQVRTAASGGEGITLCGEFRPHVVLLDVKMAEARQAGDAEPPLRPGTARDGGDSPGHGTIATAVEATSRAPLRFPREATRHRPTAGDAAERPGRKSALTGKPRAQAGPRHPVSMVGTSRRWKRFAP